MQTFKSRSLATREATLVVDNDEEANFVLQRNSSAKIAAMAERRATRGFEMHQQLQQFQEELKKLKSQLATLQEEKFHVLEELEKVKKASEETTVKLSEALSAQKLAEDGWEREKIRAKEMEQASVESAQKRDQAWQLELDAIQKQHCLDVEALASVGQQLISISDKLSSTIKEKDAALKELEVSQNRVNALSYELDLVKESIAVALKNPHLDLETEEDSGFNIQASPVIELLRNEFEKEKIMKAELDEKDTLVENLKLEISDVKDVQMRVAYLLSESRAEVGILEQELEKAKASEAKTFEMLVAQTKQWEESKISLEEAKHEISSLNKYIHSLEDAVAHVSEGLFASHHSLEIKKLQTEKEDLDHARDPLAAQKVMTEADGMKEKLVLTQAQLQDAKEEIVNLKVLVKKTEEKFQELLDEARREVENANLVAERWRLEVEESNDAWNGKESEFVQFMKISEEEKDDAKEAKKILIESLLKANETAKLAKEETARLRDILREALNEASLAKESAEIARTENLQLKDNLSEMGSELQRISQEYKRLKVSEAIALEKIKELESLLFVASDKEPIESKKANVFDRTPKDHNRAEKFKADQSKEQRKFNVAEGQDDRSPANIHKGHHKAFSVLIDETGKLNSDDFNGSHLHTDGSERILEMKQRKKKALVHRFGGLLRRKSSGSN